MYTKLELRDFLCEISEKAHFPVFTYVSARRFIVCINCRVEPDRDAKFYSEYVSEWIKKFTKFTKTGWIVRQSYPKVKRFAYRKTFVCQFSSFNKTKKPIQTDNRNKQCQAQIDFKIKFINRNTIRNNEMLKKGLNLLISINHLHSHKTFTKESLSLLRCSADTDELFCKYFADGHTDTTAKSYHELTLLLNATAGSNSLTIAEINPTLRHVNYLFTKKKKEGTCTSNRDIMPEKIKVLVESGGLLKYSEDYSNIVVITPFMKNVLSSHELDCIIVDSTALKEYVVSFFLVPTPLGALPIACALHTQSKDKIHRYNQAFNYTKTLIESQILRSFEPTKFMINDIEENYALEEEFPNASLSVTHVSLFQGIWETICKGDVKIVASRRHDLMESFHSLLYNNNLEEADLIYKKLEEDKYVITSPKLKEYLVNIWERRDNATTADKIIDVSLRILKQFLITRCFSFNTAIMMDVLLHILDKHWRQIVHALLSDKLIVETYTKLLLKDGEVIKSGKKDNKKHTQENEQKNHSYNIEAMCCDCIKGKRGEFCEHLCTALHLVNLTVTLSEEQRLLYTSLIGDLEIKPEAPTEHENELDHDLEEPTLSDDEQSEYSIIKKEKEVNDDPLDNSENDDNSENEEIDDDMKKRYVTALSALHDEFRRLDRLFMDNPSASNLDSIKQLARELSKIRPVELSNDFVDVNDADSMNEN